MPRPDISRLINPRSVALIGAAAWTDAVAAGNAAVGFAGRIWRVHPTRAGSAEAPVYRSIEELPGVPDAAFVAVPNTQVPGVARALAARGAGGFVCFSAGFAEAGDPGRKLTRELLEAAGDLPFFGPNCYGFVNFFDRVALMPDQIVGTSPARGVAIICQSGTLALTLMFNERSLPIGYLFTVGNQSRLSVNDLIEILSEDPRVSAFGLYIEGIEDAPRFVKAADRARRAGKPIAVIKSGRTAAAAQTAHTHTGSLTGADAVFDSFCRQAGIARCDTLGTLCETLKVFHLAGPLGGTRMLIMGASGGDMAMTADVSRDLPLQFAPLPPAKAAALQGLLSDRVTIANPLDLHTYLWFDPPRLRRVFAEALDAGYDCAGFMLDCPPAQRADTASFDAVIDAFIDAAQGAPTRAALISSLPETQGSAVRARCLAGGVMPLQGQRDALEALALAGLVGSRWRVGTPVVLQLPRGTGAQGAARTLAEHEGKAVLSTFGVSIPRGKVVATQAVDAEAAARDAAHAAAHLGFPVAIKATGPQMTHKTELAAVALNIRTAAEAFTAAARLLAFAPDLLVEEMVTDAVAELLVGISVDPQFGQVLVIGSGGVFAELLADTVSLLPPWTAASIDAALETLAVAKLLRGFRGKPAADRDSLVAAILAVGRYATANQATVLEIDVNPLLASARGAIAVDVLIRLQDS